MKVGVGLPVTSAASGRALLDWARRAEDLGFASLATIDRLVWPGFEAMAALAAAAAVTSRIGLRANVLLAPLRSPAVVAKQAATVQDVSGGRLLLGLGVGRRRDDYEAAGMPFATRGRRLDAGLEEIAASGAPLLFGGGLDVALPRILRHGIGWTVAVRPADEVAAASHQLRAEWQAAGRDGGPHVMAMHYFALGEGSSVDYLYRYYGYQGDRAANIAEGAARTARQAADTVAAFADAGVDEYVFTPAMPDLDQLDRLAEAVL